MGKKIWLLALVVVVGVSGLAYSFYKADSMQKQLNALAVRDNILFEEVLEVEKTAPKTTFAEYLDKLVSNRRERDELKRKVEAVEPYKNEDQIARYVELLNSENEFVRAEEARVRQMLSYSNGKNSLEAAKRRGEEAVQRVKLGQPSIGSESWFERSLVGRSDTVVDAVAISEITSNFSEASRKELSRSAAQLQEAVVSCVAALDALSEDEQKYYLPPLPHRDMKVPTQEKKKVYEKLQSTMKADKAALYLD